MYFKFMRRQQAHVTLAPVMCVFLVEGLKYIKIYLTVERVLTSSKWLCKSINGRDHVQGAKSSGIAVITCDANTGFR